MVNTKIIWRGLTLAPKSWEINKFKGYFYEVNRLWRTMYLSKTLSALLHLLTYRYIFKKGVIQLCDGESWNFTNIQGTHMPLQINH